MQNEVRGGEVGMVAAGAGVGSPKVVGNTIRGASRVGLAVGEDMTPSLEDNVICGNGTNLRLNAGATPQIDDSNAIHEICPDDPAA